MNLRYAVRRLWNAPVFTAAAVLSLALGIGAVTSLFSIVNAALLRLIPVREPGQLVWFTASEYPRLLNYPFYESLRGDPRFQSLLCAFPVTLDADAQRAPAELVSGNYFEALGVRPHLGRLLNEEDDRVAVVSYQWWQTRMGADPNVAGRKIAINGSPYTVIGVAEPGFSGIEKGFPRALFVPMKMKAALTGWDGLDSPLFAWLWIVGRVHPGVDTKSLSAELNQRFHAQQEPALRADAKLSPSQLNFLRRRTISLEPLRDAVLGTRTRDHLRTLGWIVAALLALTCANLAGLLLARGFERRRELAVRLALGATRSRLIAQLLSESALLALAGGTLGVLFTSIVTPLVASRFPLLGSGSELDVPLDGRVLAFAIGVSIVTCIGFGLLPALQATRPDLIGSMKSPGPQRRTLRHLLTAAQSGVAFVLLAAAGVYVLQLRTLVSAELGFHSRRLMIAEIEPSLVGYGPQQRTALYRAIEERLAPHGGTLTNVAPMSSYFWTILFYPNGRPMAVDFSPRAAAVGPGYFPAMRIPLQRGRLFTDRDSQRVAVISESLARRAFGGGDPIGRRFVGDSRKPAESTFEIVGVVADADFYDPRKRDHRECVYVPYRQWPFPPQSMAILLPSSEPAEAVLRQAVRDLAPKVAVFGVRTIESAMAELLVGERLLSWLSGFFALLAALLTAIGLYGVLSRDVATGARDIGIRLALGAPGGGVVRTIVLDALIATGVGVAAGGAILAVTLSPAFAIAAAALVLLSVVAAIAVFVPARRATRVDPASSLRCD